ncbi:Rid family hydrolase [Pseudomonas sp. SLFW]|uniref:Rid family hydrolase n=1 Tax=Pseudomonas sp. SLFW TaxID=2683259 RepID=UPI0014126E02|nr:Rid family hydrolase [Pseudomonas sp. SLFW]NBB09684.1 RidA family protein [Pseudomonas sp. SLFW]
MSKSVVEIPEGNDVFGVSTQAFTDWQYAPAVRAGGLLFVAGLVGVKADGTVPVSVAEQTELAFQRIAEVLRLEGLGMGDLVEVVSYHVDLKQHLDDFLPVKKRHFVEPFPAWTLIGIEALGLPELKIEIKVVAALKV